MREKTGRSDVIQKNEIYTTKSTPYLNGANGKALDTDAFAVLTDFVKVGRAVETALEDAWMANIFVLMCACIIECRFFKEKNLLISPASS